MIMNMNYMRNNGINDIKKEFRNNEIDNYIIRGECITGEEKNEKIYRITLKTINAVYSIDVTENASRKCNSYSEFFSAHIILKSKTLQDCIDILSFEDSVKYTNETWKKIIANIILIERVLTFKTKF